MIGKEQKRQKTTSLLRYVLIYLLATIVLYAFGPVDWKTHNPEITYILLFSYIISLYLGGAQGHKNSIKEEIEPKADEKESWYFRHYTLIAIVNMCLRFFSLQRIISLYGLSGIGEIYKNITTDYSAMYFAETTVQSGSEMYGGLLFSTLSLLLSPWTLVFIPMTFAYFKKLSITQKVLGITCCAMTALYKLSQGTNNGLFTLIIYIFIGIFVAREHNGVSNIGIKKRKKSSNIFIIAVFIGLFFAFSWVMNNRMGDTGEFIQIGENAVSKDGFLYNIFPETLRPTLIWADFYICQGYYGMSLATTLPWVPMLGIGSSRWLSYELYNIFPGAVEDLYPSRIESAGHVWGASANWHTAYTWFANDWSFIGVILLMFILGYIFTQACNHAIRTKNPWSTGLIMLLFQMLLFLPMNNVVFADSHTLLPFIVYLLIWLNSKVRFLPKLKF